MATESKQLHFSVDGDFITQFARSKCYDEYKLGYAIELLKSVTECENQSEAEHLQLVIDILDGKNPSQGQATVMTTVS